MVLANDQVSEFLSLKIEFKVKRLFYLEKLPGTKTLTTNNEKTIQLVISLELFRPIGLYRNLQNRLKFVFI